MSYAVVQQSVEVPDREQLKNAFRNVPGLTEIDALALGRDALGIFARGFEFELASALKDSLAAEGVAAEVVEDSSLPQLAEPLMLNNLECNPDALLIHDPLGRLVTVPWAGVFMMAAGKVAVQEFVETRVPASKSVTETQFKILKHIDGRLEATDRQPVYTGKHMHWQVRPVDVKTREEQHDRHLLEIFLNDGRRYSINADKTPLLFTYLGERRTADLSRNFILLLQDLFKHAPQAALNRGAMSAQADSDAPFTYPNKIAFYHELVWLLWLSARQALPAQDQHDDHNDQDQTDAAPADPDQGA